MKKDFTEKELQEILDRIRESGSGLSGNVSRGTEQTVVGVLGQIQPELRHSFQGTLEMLSGVDKVVPITKPYKLASREFEPYNTVISVKDVEIGRRNKFVVIAGPCAVENESQLIETAHAVKEAGANILRGGAFKPSTSPYGFRGLGEKGLKILAKAREETGLPVITEVLTPTDVALVAEYADILQVGARNMQNFILLDKIGELNKPVMLKRGMSATIQEWLLAAEYILSVGNKEVILCERGIRTFENYTRNTMDISAIPVIKKLSHLPIIADPSHATGKWYLVSPVALASVAADADGVMVEVHPDPDRALKDGAQSLNFEHFKELMSQISSVAASVGRQIPKSKD
jgi:3-deoxy-7-phosphoheptulonate synthase